MKRICILLAAVLLLSLGACAWAEGGVNVEVIKMDGISVVELIPEETMLRARSLALNALAEAPEGRADFILPEFLTLIAESAFEGISAESVEVSGNVTAIEARAFADCKSLKKITIPSTVLKIDDHAFDGCGGVTVYGTKDSEAERIVNAVNEANPDACFVFIDPNAEPETTAPPAISVKPPVVLPFVPAD